MTSISSYALTTAPRLSVAQAQAALSTAQVELSSGRLADIGLGLGSATGSYISLNTQQSRLQAITASNSTTATTLTTANSVLDALRTTATSFLASLTQSSGAGSVPGTLVNTATANLNSLISSLNTTVGGASLFGGIKSGEVPISADKASATQNQVTVSNAFSGTDTSAISKDAMQSYLGGAFAGVFEGSSWSSASDTLPTAQISSTASDTVQTSVSANNDAFRQLAQAYTMVQNFSGSGFSSDANQAVITAATQLVTSAIAGLTSAQASIGLSQTAVSNANDRMSSQIDYLSTQSTNMVSVDPSLLSTQISGLQTQIQASYEITSQLQQLSLVNYLK
ncbi:MAG: flagellar hook-associated family protein [Janthinobacterium lividum]